MILSFGNTLTRPCVIGQIEGVTQALLINPPVLHHVARYRQRMPWAREAGGQLFGAIDPEIIRIFEATGPYRGDNRSRFRYRSNPVAAQEAIAVRSQRGLLYLGEWHTHAQDYPEPSRLDDDAMQRLIAASRLNSNTLLLLIVGRAQGVESLAVWSYSSAIRQSWRLQALE